MLYDPLAVKRLASAVCVLPPTPRSLIGVSGCQGGDPEGGAERALTQERAEITLRGLQEGRTAEGSCRPRDRLEDNDPARRTWRRDKDEPGKPNAPAQSHSGRKTTRPPSERSDIQGAWGALPTTQPGTRPPPTSGTSQRRAPAGGVPVTPLGATLLRPYGSSGRAPALPRCRGRLPRFRRQPRAAQKPPRGAGRGAKPPCTARRASEARR